MKILQKITCVDDEPDMRALIRLSLENIGGYQVQEYASGQELLDNIGSWKSDIIILDAMMPVMDGLQTLAKFRELAGFDGIPVVFMTGKSAEARPELLAAGATDVITKPYDALQLPGQIQKIWEAYQNGSDARAI